MKDSLRKNDEEWRKLLAAQQRLPPDQQAAYQKALADQRAREVQANQHTTPSAPVPGVSQEELPAVKEQKQQKTGSVEQLKDAEKGISGKENDPEDTASQDAYGSNVAATPITFVRLTPGEKAALHWAAAQEYWRLHNTRMNYNEVEILAEIHGTTADSILKSINYWQIPRASSLEIINALPHRPKSYEKWRAHFMGKHNTTQGLVEAVAALDQRQKDEQEKISLNKRGCEWMTGKYYIDQNPSSLCTPVISACVEGDCINGHGTYISFNGSKFVGEFKQGNATTPDPIYLPGTCLAGNCTNGHGTYAFSDGSKYMGDFKNYKPNGQGTKTWAIGFTYTGEFKDGVATGKGKYMPPAKRNLSHEKCLEGSCNNGQGVMVYENDTKYVGQFKNDEPHGKGIYYWRTGEALEGEFDEGWLKIGGNHISPDGSIVVQKIRRGWHKTYSEEDDAAKSQQDDAAKTKLLKQFLLGEIIGTIVCRGEYHRQGTPEWEYCGQ